MDEKPCPRARYNGKGPARFLVSIDRKYRLDPCYNSMVKSYGRERAKEIIRSAVEIRGACEIIQTDMCLGGLGLFGGLSENGKEFIFYEWTFSSPYMRIHLTAQEARDIVSGKKRTVQFLPCTAAHFAARRRSKKRKKQPRKKTAQS